MARSRHGHRGAESGGDAGLPSWAQRHLSEAGEATTVAAVSPSRHRRRAAPEPAHRLRGWGVAIVSVAAAVTAVPLAVTAVSNDRSDDPLPTVDTFTAGAPGPLEAGQGAQGSTRTVERAPAEDPTTAGILQDPAGAAPAPVPPAVPLPRPAAVVRPTTVPVPVPVPTTAAPATPRAATGTATTAPKPTTTTTDEGDDGDGGRAATRPTSPSRPAPSSSESSTSGSQRDGLLPAVGRTLGGAAKAVGGLL